MAAKITFKKDFKEAIPELVRNFKEACKTSANEYMYHNRKSVLNS
jgi:hypothetical protein